MYAYSLVCAIVVFAWVFCFGFSAHANSEGYYRNASLKRRFCYIMNWSLCAFCNFFPKRIHRVQQHFLCVCVLRWQGANNRSSKKRKSKEIEFWLCCQRILLTLSHVCPISLHFFITGEGHVAIIIHYTVSHGVERNFAEEVSPKVYLEVGVCGAFYGFITCMGACRLRHSWYLPTTQTWDFGCRGCCARQSWRANQETKRAT